MSGIGAAVEERSSALPPFLRWMGSKRRDAELIATVLGGDSDRYLEPFLGSGAVFFAGHYGAGSVLSDANEVLIKTYRGIRERPDQVAEELEALALLPLKQTFLRVRRDLMDDEASIASRFLFLNANCFNGLYRTNRSGGFNVPLGSRAGRLPTREYLRSAAVKLQGVDLRCGDAKFQVDQADRGTSMYIDPPYVTNRPTYGEYGYNEYNTSYDDQLAESVERAHARGVRCVVTVGGLGKGWRSLAEHFSVWTRTRSSGIAGNRGTASVMCEFLLTNVDDAGDSLRRSDWLKAGPDVQV